MGTIQESLQRTPVRRHTWVAVYRVWLVIMDVVFATITITVSIVLRGITQVNLPYLEQLPYITLPFILVPCWILILAISHGYDKKMIGIGLQEYRHVVIGTFCFFGAIAIVSYLLRASLSRSLFVIGLPLGIVLLLLSRWICRQIVNYMRPKGWVTPTLVVGHEDSLRPVLKRLESVSWTGYKPVAVSVMGYASGSTLDDLKQDYPDLFVVPFDNIEVALAHSNISAVIVSSGVPSRQVRKLSWRLDKFDVDFLVSPSVMDVAGPRMTVRTADGLALVHVDLPVFRGWKVALKRAFDIVFSGLFLIVFSWLYLIVAIAVKMDDGGPIIFKQKRIGKDQKEFTIHKFRTMQVNAESMIGDLMDSQGSQAYFKPKNDKRITKVGKTLRKWSLDELPQFWDVLVGPMSIVGPRPQIDKEVAEYSDHHYRRLLVKPGITGPWQINGRNDLSVEDSFRLDISYVDNWSPITDILIIFQTLRIVASHEGAS